MDVNQGFRGFFDVADSAGEFDPVVQQDGSTGYQIREQHEVDPFAPTPDTITEPMGVGEFAESVAGVAGGTVAGVAGQSLGMLGDGIGLISGISAGLTAEEGEGFISFLEEFADKSEKFGSEYFFNKFEEEVDQADLSPEVKESLLAGSEYVGQFAAAPSVLKGMTQAYRLGKQAAQMVDLKGGPTALAPSQRMGFRQDVETQIETPRFSYEELPQVSRMDELPQEVVDELTVTQPMTSTKEAVEFAKHNQAVLGNSGKKISAELGIQFKDPGVKGSKDAGKRLMEKAQERGDVNRLTDITRAGFVIDTLEQADQVIEMLARDHKIIDEGFNVTKAGYFDRKVMVINPDGQIGEIQIWPKQLIEAKEKGGGHKLYEIIRAKPYAQMDAKEKREYTTLVKKFGLPKDDQAAAKAGAEEQSRVLYAEALEKSDPSFKSVLGESK